LDIPSSVIDACKQGDPDGFAELIRLSNREVYGLAFRITGNPEDAADVAQDTYIKLLKSIKQFRGDSKFSTWLYRVTSSVAISHMRRKSRKTGLDRALEPDDWEAMPATGSADPVARSEQNSLRDRLDAAVSDLPAAYRSVVVMKDVYGFSLQEVGDQLGITEGAAKVRLFRARQRLRDVLHEDEEQAPKGGNKNAVK